MGAALDTQAVVLAQPHDIGLRALHLDPPSRDDLVVDLEWSGISTGTERLLYSGAMPPFPGMGYPLVPGYESVGRVVQASARAQCEVGDRVFVPGAACYGEVRGLFGGAASRLVVPERRVALLDDRVGREGTLLALAATAHHALVPQDRPGAALPELIVGHGVLGRLVARMCIALGGRPPVVWERDRARHGGAEGYDVVTPDEDPRFDYRVICDVSGDAGLLDTLVARLARRGEVVLAGFYSEPIQFVFAPAFMKEARLRIAAEWESGDLTAVLGLLDLGRLSLDGLISHEARATAAPEAYRTAFEDGSCLKMILDWSDL
ncbi:MAG: chlorophyll synthesis pathway protein BchC [Pseudomonadota bacterium]|nr:chlorophyll synthesis pathway protein BchC [Pseudomonadota bacterium]